MKRTVIVLLLLCLSLAGCSYTGVKKQQVSIEVTEKIIAITEGEAHKATAIKRGGTGNIEWSAENDKYADVSKSGLITAKKSGRVKLKVKYNDKVDYADLYVAESIVDSDYADGVPGYGVTRFNAISDAVKAGKGKSILLYEGYYNETLDTNEDLSLVGIGKAPVLRGLTCSGVGKKVSLTNLQFYNNEYPVEKRAVVSVGEQSELEIAQCTFVIDKKEDKPKDRKGGYAIYYGREGRRFSMTSSNVIGFRYGVFADKGEGVYYMEGNSYEMCNIGLGIDLRPYDVAGENRNARGEIKNNVFIRVDKPVEILYNGTDYSGKLKISEVTKAA